MLGDDPWQEGRGRTKITTAKSQVGILPFTSGVKRGLGAYIDKNSCTLETLPLFEPSGTLLKAHAPVFEFLKKCCAIGPV